MQERLGVLLLATFALAVACNKQGSATAAPGADAATAGAETPSIDDLERQLSQLHGELEQHAVREQETPTGDRAVDDGDGSRCTRTCELTTAICGLRGQICELAAEHDDEPRYAAACSRASDDCERATEACDDCSA
ncbi:MAG: hypothetical protein IAG13_15875 [Deltaproteobacteria bacterium]|nr:hypothetical protein [Nannocystaceae bacterium]